MGASCFWGMLMKIVAGIAAAFLSVVMAAPASAQETITSVFTKADGGVTAQTYFGQVQVRVSGTGFSLGPQINDAFYFTPSGSFDGSYYQLTFGTSTLLPNNPSRNAVNFITGGRPTFQSSGIYNFVLNTGLTQSGATNLHFGVGDGNFGDNGGSYQITVSQLGAVPEPATWGMMLLGFGALGGAMRVRRRSAHGRSVMALG